MKRLACTVAFAMMACLGARAAVALEQAWYINYETAVKLIQKNRFQEAESLLLQALAARSIPDASVSTYGLWTIDYTPYYYLGVAYMGQNRPDEARKAFRTSLLWGVVKADSAKMTVMKRLSGMEAAALLAEPSDLGPATPSSGSR